MLKIIVILSAIIAITNGEILLHAFEPEIEMPDFSSAFKTNIFADMDKVHSEISSKMDKIKDEINAAIKKKKENSAQNVNGDQVQYSSSKISSQKVQMSYQVNGKKPVTYRKEKVQGTININGDEHSFSYST